MKKQNIEKNSFVSQGLAVLFIIFTSIELCGASLEDAFVKLTEVKSHANV